MRQNPGQNSELKIIINATCYFDCNIGYAIVQLESN